MDKDTVFKADGKKGNTTAGGARSERNAVTGSWNGRDSFFNLHDGVGKCALLAAASGRKVSTNQAILSFILDSLVDTPGLYE